MWRSTGRSGARRHATAPPGGGYSELVNLSVGRWDQHRASFETAASRLPQDEVLLNAIKEVPHPEEAHSAVSKDAGCSCSPSFANSFTSSEEVAHGSGPRPARGQAPRPSRRTHHARSAQFQFFHNLRVHMNHESYP